MESWERRSRPFVMAACLGFVALVGVIDWLTGFEIFFSVFYLLGVGLATWFVGKGFGFVVSILSVVVWIAGDFVAGARYSSSFIPIWNAMILLAFYSIVVWLLTSLRSLHKELEDKVRQRTVALTPQPSPRSFLTGRGGWRCRLFCGLLSKHFLFAMIGCAALAQNTSFAAPSGLASDGKSASEKAGNLHRSKSGAAAKEKSVENERTKERALAIRPQSVVPPAQRSLKNARDRGSGPAIIGGPADSKKNASALIGGPANATRKTAVIDGTALRNR